MKKLTLAASNLNSTKGRMLIAILTIALFVISAERLPAPSVSENNSTIRRIKKMLKQISPTPQAHAKTTSSEYSRILSAAVINSKFRECC